MNNDNISSYMGICGLIGICLSVVFINNPPLVLFICAMTILSLAILMFFAYYSQKKLKKKQYELLIIREEYLQLLDHNVFQEKKDKYDDDFFRPSLWWDAFILQYRMGDSWFIEKEESYKQKIDKMKEIINQYDKK